MRDVHADFFFHLRFLICENIIRVDTSNFITNTGYVLHMGVHGDADGGRKDVSGDNFVHAQREPEDSRQPCGAAGGRDDEASAGP